MPGHSVSMSGAPRRFRFSIGPFDQYDLAFALVIVALFVLVGATFREYAVSNDEGLQHHYGELIVAYYKSGFADKSVFDYGNLYLYGGLFDIIAVLLAHALPFDPYDIRHVMCAVAGIGGVAATWATARMIAGPRAGLLAGLALALCGVWYGSMFNHTKDVPFASAMMGATFFLLRAARDLPDSRRRDILWFGILLGAALGLRATGLLMVCYAVALIGFAVMDPPAAGLAPVRTRERPLVAAFRSRLRHRLCHHDRILAVGVAGIFQSGACDFCFRALSLPDPDHYRRPRLLHERRAALVRT